MVSVIFLGFEKILQFVVYMSIKFEFSYYFYIGVWNLLTWPVDWICGAAVAIEGGFLL